MRTSGYARHSRAVTLATIVLLAAACAEDTTRVLAPRSTISAERGPVLGACDRLAAPEGATLSYHVYARGVQIYQWNGASWAFVAPSADLFANAGFNGNGVGTHYVGPTWRSVSGSTVVGAVIDRCTPDANAIPWLSLGVVSSAGPGIFDGTTFIQRVNTVGGKAPSAPGTSVGEVTNVPYTAEYFFYR